MTKSLRIGLLHLAPELGALDPNRGLIQSRSRIAAGLGADWVVSGRAVPGYRFVPVLGTEWIREQPDLWMRRLFELTAELGIVSFVGYPERDSKTRRLFNSVFVIGRDGRVVGRQRKLHRTPIGEGWASSGDLRRPVLVDGLQVGLPSTPAPTPRSPRAAYALPARSCCSRLLRGGRASGVRSTHGYR